MDLKIKGRRALITGSSLGIGYAIAETLAREGASVVVNGRRTAPVEAAVARIRAQVPGANVSGVAADVTTEAGAKALFAAVADVDILVNNLGAYERKYFFETTDDDWRRMFEINVLSGVRLSRFYAEKMKSRGWGRVLFISSESGMLIPVEMIHYGASKTMQIAAARGLATELAGSGVTVNSVLPGPTRSDGFSVQFEAEARATSRTVADLESEVIAKGRPSSLTRRIADPQEVANLVAYLAGEGASATTGASMRVDGGIVTSL